MNFIKHIIFIFILLSNTTTLFGQEDVEQLFKDKKYEIVTSILSKKAETKELTMREYFLITKSYGRNKQYSNGFVFAQEWMQKCRLEKDTTNLVAALTLKAENLIDLNKIKQGIEFCESASEVYREQDSLNFQSLCFVWGMLYYQNKEYEKAYETYNKITSKKYKELSMFSTNYGLTLLGMEKWEEAIAHFKKGIQINLDSKSSPVTGLFNVAHVYIGREKWDEALVYLDSAKSYLREKSTPRQKKLLFTYYFDFYNAQNKPNEAAMYLLSLRDIDEQIFNTKLNEEIYALKTSYKREKVLNRSLEYSKKEKLWGTIILLFIILALLSILFLFKYRNMKTAHENVLTEQRLLRSQMTPHFIFNSLSVLQGMILNKEEKKAVRYLSKFSKLLRLILENSREKLVPIDEELKAIQNYVDLHNMRSETPFKFTLDLDENLTDLDILIPPMLIQPFVENAIEHGFKKDFENAKISIEIMFKDNVLTCIIKDNGIGLNASVPKTNPNKKSLSTKITSERLKIFSKEYKVESGVIIQDRSIFNEKGTQIELTLPYKIEHYA